MIKNNLIICADDFGQNEAICEGILLAAKRKRINAVSCMVNTPEWTSFSPSLLAYRANTKIGLHLNFTEGLAKSPEWRKIYNECFKSLSWLIQKAYFRQLDKTLVSFEIAAQIKSFIDALGFYPDFIDGHQHIHQLPVIREALLEEIKGFKSLFRNTANHYRDLFSLQGFPKRQGISLLGGFYFKRLLKQEGLLLNKHFSGIYNFGRASNYRYYFQKFLKEVQDGGLIMCHPGLPSKNTEDPLAASRPFELAYLLSDDFLADLKSYDYYCF